MSIENDHEGITVPSWASYFTKGILHMAMGNIKMFWKFMGADFGGQKFLAGQRRENGFSDRKVDVGSLD